MLITCDPSLENNTQTADHFYDILTYSSLFFKIGKYIIQISHLLILKWKIYLGI